MPKRNPNRPKKDREPSLEITPMLDVTFLLLIFFLCTIQFKILDGRLDAFLPKEIGAGDRSSVLESIEIRIVPEREASHVYVGRTLVEKIGNFVGDDVENLRLPTLSQRIGDLHRMLPDASCVIDPDRGVPHGHVVAVLNTVKRHDLSKVTFTFPHPRLEK